MKCLMAEVNFSEGRNQDLISAVKDAMLAGDPIDLMEISSDADHNRTVFTFKGEPKAVLEATKRLSAKAVELIDMTKQAYEDMVHLTKENRIFDQRMADLLLMKAPEQTLAYYRHGLVFVFNFHFGNSLNNVLVPVRQPGEYTVVLSTDDEKYGGFGNVAEKIYATKRFDGRDYIELYIPARTGFVLKEKVILPETPAALKKVAK